MRWKEMLYFEHFFLIPTLATFDMNDYSYGKKWVYRRFFTLYIFWWEFSLEWRHGDAKKMFNL